MITARDENRAMGMKEALASTMLYEEAAGFTAAEHWGIFICSKVSGGKKKKWCSLLEYD